MRWSSPAVAPGKAARLAKASGISLPLATLLVTRGFTGPEEIDAFLQSGLGSLSDPLLCTGMEAAVSRVARALENQESVVIFGDYDVDGVTSTTLLTHFLKRYGCQSRYLIPKRREEGYGLSIDSMERLLEEGKPDLLIAVDCGTSSADEVAWLRDREIDVLILDHHTSKEAVPTDCILVNPHLHDPADVPWKDLCSVGLVFKFCHAFLKVMREKGDPLAAKLDLRDYLDLVALGTVADLVRLRDENRILVKSGLKRLRRCRRPGICALIEAAGLTLGDYLSVIDIGFRLGPRINASGRLDDASVPIQLLLSDDFLFCRQQARILDGLNRDRQQIERSITGAAEKTIHEAYSGDMGLVLHSSDWHTGVVGIVASRLARKFNRPTLVLGTEADGCLKGSGRSVEGVNLVEVLATCSDHLLQWGGHPMAVGLSASEAALPALREAFNHALQTLFPEGLPEPELPIDLELSPADLNVRFLKELDQLAPFGQGNPEPVFALRKVNIEKVTRMGRDHCRFLLPRPAGRAPLDGVAWNVEGRPPPAHVPMDMAVKFEWNTFRGQRSPRVTLLDWQVN